MKQIYGLGRRGPRVRSRHVLSDRWSLRHTKAPVVLQRSFHTTSGLLSSSSASQRPLSPQTSASSQAPTTSTSEPSSSGAVSSISSTNKFFGRSDVVPQDGEPPSMLYSRLVKAGELQEDPQQRKALEVLDGLFSQLLESRKTSNTSEKPGAPSRGLYIHGPAGSGKSLSMDLFHLCLLQRRSLARRQHFHEFVYELHVRLKQFEDGQIGGKTTFTGVQRQALSTRERLRALAREITQECDGVLCFDEFAITTIQDCTMLTTLLREMFDAGVVLVTTSNRQPEDLYEDGLNRHMYLPEFLELLHSNCDVIAVAGGKDYRCLALDEQVDGVIVQQASSTSKSNGIPVGPTGAKSTKPQLFFSAEEALTLKEICATAASSSADTKDARTSESGAPMKVPVAYGRFLHCETHGPGWALFEFGPLFKEGNFSADDFNMLCRRFHSLVIQDVPALTTDDHNAAKRFTNFLDCAYEHHCRVIFFKMQAPSLSAVFDDLRSLEQLRMADFGQDVPAGAADQDTTPEASAIVQAIKKLKERKTQLEEGDESAADSHPEKRMRHPLSLQDFEPERDMDIWRQDARGMPQVTKSWDDRRRAAQFLWEAADPTAEQQTFKGVFAAAIASLHETGFAVKRAISRLHEMQSPKYLDIWEKKRFQIQNNN
ncbi:unnamed protein product [Amoebophrya sp. A25]|nr:unnamed protein product [Amoebophrya sp. A25]|eukprot:GSA25T00009292001.1